MGGRLLGAGAAEVTAGLGWPVDLEDEPVTGGDTGARGGSLFAGCPLAAGGPLAPMLGAMGVVVLRDWAGMPGLRLGSRGSPGAGTEGGGGNHS